MEDEIKHKDNGLHEELSFSTKLMTILLSVVIVAAGAGIMYLLINYNGEKKENLIPEPVKHVNTSDVRYTDYNAIITTFGRLNAKSKVDIYSEVGGKLTKAGRSFKIGTNYGKGSVIFRVDDEEARLNLFSQRSEFLNQLINILPDIKTDYTAAFEEWDNYLKNFDIKKDLKELPETNDARLKYYLASRNIYKFYYTIKNAEYRLTKYDVRAPISGSVILALVESGTNIMPGQKLGTMSGSGIFELEVSVDKQDLKYIKIGDEADVSSSGSGLQRKGKIIRIGSNLDPSTLTVPVFISLTGNGLKDGMYLKAVIHGEKVKDVFRIPRKAVVNNEFIYIIRDSLLDKHNVEIVRFNDDYAFIKGLPEGTTAITDPLYNISLGIKVLPIKKNTFEKN